MGEQHLLKALKHILPNSTKIHQNYRHPDLLHPDSGTVMELDVYVPIYHLAFEFQGKQHYEAYFKGSKRCSDTIHFLLIYSIEQVSMVHKDNEMKQSDVYAMQER